VRRLLAALLMLTLTMVAAPAAEAATPTPAPTATTTPKPGGAWPGAMWSPSYTENFTTPAALGQVGTVYGQAMRGYDGCCDSKSRGVYAPDSVLSVSGGSLNYNLHTESGRPLVAAPQPLGWTGQKYGRFQVRWRTNVAPSYAVAFLLWPVSEDWNDGEVDWPEVHGLGSKPRPASAIPGSYGASCDCVGWHPWPLPPVATTTAGWHTDATEWKPGSVSWYRDNVLIATTTKAVPTTPFRWSLQAETNPELDGTIPAAEVGSVQIDSLRAWTYVG
jgi:beta-glucanase (GH16 family)